MNKSDLIKKIVNLNSGVYQKDASKIVNIFFNTISNAVLKSDRVELGFVEIYHKKLNLYNRLCFLWQHPYTIYRLYHIFLFQNYYSSFKIQM